MGWEEFADEASILPQGGFRHPICADRGRLFH
jgi:hypothetical protein